MRELAGLLIIGDTGSFTLIADEVISELGRLGGLPAPDHARCIVQRLYAETALRITDLLLTAYAIQQPATAHSASEQPEDEAADPVSP